MEKASDKTLFVSFLLDETGSMQSIKDDTIEGFNAYLKELKTGDATTLLSLVSFNSSETKKRYVAEPIQQIKPLTPDTYRPEAMTPLIDASVKIIKATAEAVEARNDDVDVVIVIQTDGLENVSVEYTRADLALLVKEKQAAGWQFLFLAAGLDAFEAAQDAGLQVEFKRSLTYGRGQSKEMFDLLAKKMKGFAYVRSTEDLDFTDDERAAVDDSAKPTSQGGQPTESDPGRRPSTVDDLDLLS